MQANTVRRGSSLAAGLELPLFGGPKELDNPWVAALTQGLRGLRTWEKVIEAKRRCVWGSLLRACKEDPARVEWRGVDLGGPQAGKNLTSSVVSDTEARRTCVARDSQGGSTPGC